ncbi:MAG: beta-glucosidase [Gammaproteobacteria bacterium 28-57-27]|nr:MAG: beta-glucosidase [Gammaproteobacteria bacterium 28-57-27]
MPFPTDFTWGVATSSYQIEGSPLADGAGLSNWHRFALEAGRVLNDDHGETACDHYRRSHDDVALIKELGVDAYRFSFNWARIQPNGKGVVNEKGLDFYRRLVDALLEHGIQPFATLHHWDLPAALEDAGGWLNRDTAHRFADFTEIMTRALDGQIQDWCTFNEPWVIMHEGHVNGAHPPGLMDLAHAPIVANNLLRAHAEGVRAYRANGCHRIGLVVNIEPKYAASDSLDDQAAQARAESYMNRLFIDPIITGEWPQPLVEAMGEDAWRDVLDESTAPLREPIDWLGVNYYSRSVVRHKDGGFLDTETLRQARAHTEMGWEVYPQGLTDTLVWLSERTQGLPLYVTENGAAFDDPPVIGGRVDDQARVDYLREHLHAAAQAIEMGVNLRGYFAWSLLDNFEWQFGYSKRFGLVHVDPATQQRTFKDSAHFLREICHANT